MPRAKTPTYIVSLELADGTLTGKGKSVIEALQQIKPPFLKSRGIFTVEFDGKRSQQMMFPMVIKRLLVNEIAQQIFEKRMTLMLK